MSLKSLKTIFLSARLSLHKNLWNESANTKSPEQEVLYFETTVEILKQLGYSSLSYKPGSQLFFLNFKIIQLNTVSTASSRK